MSLFMFAFIGSANTFFLPMMGMLVMLSIYTIWRIPPSHRRPMLILIGVLAMICVASFAVVFSAPGNAVRQEAVFRTYGFTTPSLDAWIGRTLVLTGWYLVQISGLAATFLGFCIGIVFTMAIHKEDRARIAQLPLSRYWRIDMLAIVVVVLGIVMGTVATSVYGVGIVSPHIMFLPRVAQILGAAALGYMVAVLLARRGFPSAYLRNRPIYRLVRMSLLGLIILPPLAALGFNLSLLPRFQQYAQDWDAGHQMILGEIAAGNRGTIELQPYRFSVAKYLGLEELDNPTGFTRACAASYYGVDEIVMDPVAD